MTDEADRQPSPTWTRWSWPLAAWASLAVTLLPTPAAAQFTVAGTKVSPQETNFAGVRHVSPPYVPGSG